MTIRGEVSYKVRHAVLVVRQFTVSQLVEITGLERPGVETVVQRLVKDGVICPEETVRASLGRGRPQQLYKLVEDSAQIRKLRESIEAFQTTELALPAQQIKPESAYYLEAISNLDAMDKGELEATTDLLAEVGKQLQLARHYEDMLDEGSDVSNAYLDFAQARLEFLRGNIPIGEKLLAQARTAFADLNLDQPIQVIDAYVLASAVRRLFGSQVLVAADGVSKQFKPVVEALLRLNIASSLSDALLVTLQVADTTIQAKLSLEQENKNLREQIELLGQQNVWLILQQQNLASLDRRLQPSQRQPLPGYPKHGFRNPILKEDQKDLIFNDIMEKAVTLDLWPEFTERQQQQKARLRAMSKSIH